MVLFLVNHIVSSSLWSRHGGFKHSSHAHNCKHKTIKRLRNGTNIHLVFRILGTKPLKGERFSFCSTKKEVFVYMHYAVGHNVMSWVILFMWRNLTQCNLIQHNCIEQWKCKETLSCLYRFCYFKNSQVLPKRCVPLNSVSFGCQGIEIWPLLFLYVWF